MDVKEAGFGDGRRMKLRQKRHLLADVGISGI
jgi:hypothetical protein